jgi:hypothetical protein
MKTLIKIAFVLLIANAVFQTGRVYVKFYEFEDAIQEGALFANRMTDDEVVDMVMGLADERDVPINADTITVRRSAGQLIIEGEYVDDIPVVPGYVQPWTFKPSVSIRTFSTAPPPPSKKRQLPPRRPRH